MINLSDDPWTRTKEYRLFCDLQNLWTLVTERPGSSLRAIARELDVNVYQARRLVNLLLESGTLVREQGKGGTLRATVPMITCMRF